MNLFVAFEKFNDYVIDRNSKGLKERRETYDIITEYLSSSPECVEVLDVISDKEVYLKPEVGNCCFIGFWAIPRIRSTRG